MGKSLLSVIKYKYSISEEKFKSGDILSALCRLGEGVAGMFRRRSLGIC